MQNSSVYKQLPGYFIFEGIDGCGKSTVIKGVVEKFRAAGLTAQILKEPGTTSIGQGIRDIVIDNPGASSAHALLFLANRADISTQLGNPFFPRKEIVLSDRGFPSMVQQWDTSAKPGEPLSLDWLWDLHERTCFPQAFPQAVVYLSPPPWVIVYRLKARELKEGITKLEARYLYTEGLIEEDMAKYEAVLGKARDLGVEIIQVSPSAGDHPEETTQEVFDRLWALPRG